MFCWPPFLEGNKSYIGCDLTIKDYDGKVIDEWVSTTEPHMIEDLKPGIYTLNETIAPEGYILSDERENR